MADKLNHTKGIVLRSVKYGETSMIVAIFTELFGIQSYLINGIRTVSSKGSNKAVMFQPAAMLDMIVYHNELKQLQRIKEYRWNYIYNSVLTEVPRNAIALFMVELLTKCLKQPEQHQELYAFAEDAFAHLDKCEPAVAANFPLFFALHLPVFFGFRCIDNYSKQNDILDLMEGSFVAMKPPHPYFLEDQYSLVASQLLKTQHPEELKDIKLNHDFRRILLHALEQYYSLHIQDFGNLRTLPVLRTVLG